MITNLTKRVTLLAGASLRPLRTAQVKDAGRPATRAHRPVRERAGRPRTPRWAVLSGTLALAFFPFAFAASASAAVNPISSGLTTIHLAKPFTAILKKNKVKITAVAPAKVKGATISFPVSSGSLDSDTAMGAIGEEGSIKLKAPHGATVLRQFSLHTTSTPLYAVTGGAQIKLANGSGISLSRDGFGSNISFRTLKLSHNFVGRLNTLLHLKVFKQGQQFGSVTSTAQPLTVAIAPAGKVTLTPNPQPFAKLAARHVSVNPVFPAELSSGSFGFPLTFEGAISPNATLGSLKTNNASAIELLVLHEKTSTYGQVIIRELWLNFEAGTVTAELEVQPSPPYKGKLNKVAVFGLDMATAMVSSNPSARTIAVSGATATLNSTLTEAFNEALATGEGEVFKAGETFGTLSFVATEE